MALLKQRRSASTPTDEDVEWVLSQHHRLVRIAKKVAFFRSRKPLLAAAAAAAAEADLVRWDLYSLDLPPLIS